MHYEMSCLIFLKFLGHTFLVTVSYVQIVPHETPRACASVGHTERENSSAGGDSSLAFRTALSVNKS